jgi:Na+/proline symporter
LSQGTGWGVILGFGGFFTIFTMALTFYEQRVYGTTMTSEAFNTAGRNVGVGLTAAVIVSQWTWAATLLMSSNMGWRVGLAGPFWYASGATVQILLFAILAIQVKRRASHMHTFMEIIKARFGTVPHLVMIMFALSANIIVTAMLLLGGAGTVEDLTGVPKIWASFLIPILSCWIYTMYGGLRATFFASYVHTTVIFLMLIIFTLSVYAGAGDCSGLYGSPSAVYDALEAASEKAYFEATVPECEILGDCTADGPRDLFSGIGFIMENAGTCYNADGATETSCTYLKKDKDDACCSEEAVLALPEDGVYCRANGNCIDTGTTEHYESTDCGAGETCVTSFLTMKSTSGILFGITNIVGNFGTVFVDQSYWQSAVAAKPKSAVMGFLVGGMVWFAVPFCMATTNGIAGRALTTHPTLGSMYLDSAASGSGLTPARVLAHIMGPGGAFILLLQLFMAITSTGSAEIIAVSSILTYDVYYTYLNPELKERRESTRALFFATVGTKNGRFDVMEMQELFDKLVKVGFFPNTLSSDDMIPIYSALNGATDAADTIDVKDLYDALNRTVSSNSLEGTILLRMSKFFTFVFAVFMGFLAIMLQAIGLNLGWVYMSMGVLIGSAVGPASLAILMETANGIFIAAGAIGGLIAGLLAWCLQAKVEFGEVTIDTLGKDMPFVAGNVAAILGGLFIAGVGSLIMPDKEFKWEMLNERIPLVDDIEPPKDSQETDVRLQRQVKIAYGASVLLTFLLIIVWPLPMHFGGVGVFSKGRFAGWVAVEIIWAFIGGIVIIFLPVYETVRDANQAKKQRKQAVEERKLKNGLTLTVDVKPSDVAPPSPAKNDADMISC